MLRGADPPAARAHPKQPESVQLAGTVIIQDEPVEATDAGEDGPEAEGADEVTLNVKRFMEPDDGLAEPDDGEYTPKLRGQHDQPSPKERTQQIIREAAVGALPPNLKMLAELPREHASKSYRLQTTQHFLSMDLGEDLFHCIYEAVVRPNRGKEPYVVLDQIRQVMTARGEKLSLASDQLLHDLIQQEQDMFQ